MGLVLACYYVDENYSTELNKGKAGKESAAAKYAAATPSADFSIQEEKPYAEVRFVSSIISVTLLSILAMDGYTSFTTVQGSRDPTDSTRSSKGQSSLDVTGNKPAIWGETSVSIQSLIHSKSVEYSGTPKQEARRTAT